MGILSLVEKRPTTEKQNIKSMQFYAKCFCIFVKQWYCTLQLMNSIVLHVVGLDYVAKYKNGQECATHINSKTAEVI